MFINETCISNKKKKEKKFFFSQFAVAVTFAYYRYYSVLVLNVCYFNVYQFNNKIFYKNTQFAVADTFTAHRYFSILVQNQC